MPLLFTYGTLQDPAVPLRVFGRLPLTRPATLADYTRVAAGALFNAVPARGATLAGAVLDVTEDELLVIDVYEAKDHYRRIAVTLTAGDSAWMYVADARAL